MSRRIPHGESPVELRKFAQRISKSTSVITTGLVGEILIGAGSGVAPVWGKELTSLTLLTVDNITINGATITSDTGAISFSNEDLTTTGTISGGMLLIDDLILDGASIESDSGAISFGDEDLSTAGSITGVNVTSGADPGHTHTGASIAGLDISSDTNLAVVGPIVLTDDTISITIADIDHGGLGGLGDVADHIGYSLIDGTRAFTGVVAGVDPTSATHLATKEYVDQAVSFIQDFYFNNTVSDIGGGSYYQMEELPTGGPSGDFSTGPLNTGDGQALTAIFATEVGHPGTTSLEHGIYSAHIHAAVTVGNKPVRIYFEVWRYETAGPTETLIATSELSDLITIGVGIDLHSTLTDDVTIGVTDRLLVKYFANVGATGGAVTIVLYTEGTSSAHFAIPASSEVLSSIFLRQDGTKDLIGNLTVSAGITIDGVDLSAAGYTAGSGLAGGGDLIAARTIDLDINSLAAAGIAGGDFVPFWDITATATNKKITFTNFEAALTHANLIGGHNLTTDINHDALTNYVADKHVAHAGVSIATAATSGIAGGGTIAATRNLSLNINGLTGESAVVGGDSFAFYDTTAGANRKCTLTELSTALGASDEKVKVDAAATAGYLGAAANDGVLRVDDSLSYTDGGNFVTLSGSGTKARVGPTNAQDVVTGTWTQIVLDDEEFDPGGDFASNVFTAPETGYYLVIASLRTNEDIATGKYMYVAVRKNGAAPAITQVFVENTGAAAFLTGKLSDVIYLTATDTLGLWFQHNNGDNREVATASVTFLTVHRLS